MTKAIYRPEYEVFLDILKRRRIEAGLTQVECSKALGRPQSFMSDVERGSRRLDIIQIRDLCKVLGCDFPTLVLDFERTLESRSM
ncbi:helix-turn-helix domain-containing protein [Pseudomonas aeruginosa]|uniref:helix-turn-helix domain-containing protein n=1 Tax=Pseudomonas aeruginosa TaxID=287 RepID=UPI00157164CB|nr:helix-turn-helix transcriptional regulator [Pseudomonas aeruginosa]MBH9054902.1 helix-turn-helix transcriptional regulator [Pseudomonas aeruginosa]MBI8810965.1 helix-turn-helix transcriptional regulator [Pseudomonas aeruginosa]NTT41789.1 helix-turn-helix transcriptional regulator [Pseudomonas aeruginosa]HCF3884659.1 helix-turn-helix transcriptional regulator [Pseudomonas aeruginosa]